MHVNLLPLLRPASAPQRPQEDPRQSLPMFAEASPIYADKLWQGSRPHAAPVRASGIGTLVLCAVEFQPPKSAFRGVHVVHIPLDDREMCESQPDRHGRLRLRFPTQMQHAVWRVGQHVADRVASGERVLVTCMAGRNRSGIVNAIALHLLTGWSGLECGLHVKAHRALALTNRSFFEYVSRIPARPVHAPVDRRIG